jgi:hypothetical protein
VFKPSRNIAHCLLLASGIALSAPATVAAAETLPDPMRPPNASVFTRSSKSVQQHYYLSSILISPEHRSAIINGKSVVVGDRIGNARVRQIQGNEVTIVVSGKTRTLTLLPLSIKKPAEASRQ